MEIDRRDFVKLSLCAGGSLFGMGGAGIARAVDSSPINEPLYAAARRDLQGRYSAAIFTLSDGDVRSVPLPARGHDIAVRPLSSEVVVFARRPGRFAIAFTGDKAKKPVQFFAKETRHFYGHGVFSPDGRLLYTTENDFENGAGVIGVRDATASYRQIGEFPSFGIGPHDMALMADGITMVIANGGIETSPENGRKILNLSAMEPSLVYINRLTGELLEKQTLPKSLAKLSIRHLTVAGKDRVVFGCQYKGPAQDQPELMGFHKRGGEIKFRSAPDNVQAAMKNYVGSVTADPSLEVIAASAPRGNMVTFWRARDGEFLGTRNLKDGCGVAKAKRSHEFLLTSGAGIVGLSGPNQTVGSPDKSALRNEHLTLFQWDNHAVHVN